MSQTTRRNEEAGEAQEDRFTPVGGVERVDEPLLRRMNEPEKLVEDGDAVFAVAYRSGVLRTPDDSHEYETACVLYLSADGRRAVERYFSQGVTAAPRACIIPANKLYEAQPDGSASPLADALEAHPEVSQ